MKRIDIEHTPYDGAKSQAALRMLVLTCTLSSVLMLFSACGDAADNGGERDSRQTVVVSILPVGQWVHGVAAGELRVLTLLPANANPHTFELLPRQILEASGSRLLLFIGAGLEQWSDKLVSNLESSRPTVLYLSDGFELLQDGHEHSAHHGHTHEFGNPHVWLDPLFAVAAVERVRDALCDMFPEKKDYFMRNASNYIDSLRALDATILERTEAWTHRRFVADHSSWPYFAKRYGLEESGAIEAQPGREVSAKEMASLIRRMKQQNIVALFADVRSAAKGVTVLAEETSAGIARLDPQGGMFAPHSYIAYMMANVEAMESVLR